MENFRELTQEELKDIEGGLPFIYYLGAALLGFLWGLASGGNQ
jgi:lactobin A/cerein 7B family class IIb bacteriocin